LDLYCSAGGAAVGYAQAGFTDITGVDIRPQPRYPFRCIQANVFDLTPEWIVANFDAVHASPICQGDTVLRHAPGTKSHPDLIGPTFDLLNATGKPYILENVEGARRKMRNPITLCGSMFGLGAQGCRLERHRLFSANFPILPVTGFCSHGERPVIGIYGGHARRRSARAGGRGTRDIWEGGHRSAASEALAIDWMTLAEMSESIPPAYTRWLGTQMLAHLRKAA
jgi:DNA (cytosine-5)-methyltransferase 1